MEDPKQLHTNIVLIVMYNKMFVWCDDADTKKQKTKSSKFFYYYY